MEERIYNPQKVELFELKDKCGIYQIRNTVNENIYIGSAKDIRKRLWTHQGNLKRNTHDNPYLQHAYNKYGKDNFVFEVIEFCEEQKRFEIEQYWINRFIGKDCYNINPLASQPPIHYGTKVFSDQAKQNIRLAIIKPVVCLETQKEFESVTEAAKKIGLASGVVISKVCKGKNITCGGYHWLYKDDYDKLTEKEIRDIIKTKRGYATIECICIDTNKIYKSITDAYKDTNINQTLISKCCLGKCTHAGGFKWMFKEDYIKLTEQEKSQLKQLPLPKQEMACKCVETNEIFSGISEASRKMNLNRICIGRVCDGRLKTTGGYHFCYV